jgi:hypothetical protein
MKRTPASRLEIGANVAVIVAALVVVAVAASRMWPQHSHVPPASYAAGEPLGDVPGVDFRGSERTVLLFVRSTCRFCTESMPFYGKIVVDARAGQYARVIAVSDEEIDVTKSYFARHGVPIQEVVKTDAQRLRIAGTPTILVVDRGGSVQGAWVGTLGASAQSDVLRSLTPG